MCPWAPAASTCCTEAADEPLFHAYSHRSVNTPDILMLSHATRTAAPPSASRRDHRRADRGIYSLICNRAAFFLRSTAQL